MFNGIIFNTGLVKKINKKKKGINLFLKSNLRLTKKDIGISISCDGVCLTLINIKKKLLEFYLSKETMKRSKFIDVNVGTLINLELPLKYGKHISGHFCQGHVDSTAKVLSIKKIGIKCPNPEGTPKCDWVIVDAGSIIVHLFRSEIRDLYNLEKLWNINFDTMENKSA